MEIIDAFIDATRDHSLREAGALVGVSHNTVARWRKGVRSDLQPATRRGMLAFLGGQQGQGIEEETSEQAVTQSEVEREIENALRVVRLVDGKDDFTPEQRQGLKRDILRTYIKAFREDGFDTRELEAMLGRLSLGEL